VDWYLIVIPHLAAYSVAAAREPQRPGRPQLSADLEIENGEDDQMVYQTHHKEEGNGRIISDAEDRERLRKKLEVITDPLDQENHRSPGKSSINIVIGKLGTSAVNVSDAVAIGKTMCNNFETSWSDGFYGTISKKVTTMAVTNKSVPVGA